MVRALVNRPVRSFLAFLALGGALALVLAHAPTLRAQGLAKSDSKVKATADATKADASGRQVVTVTLNIDKGWHIYANPTDSPKVDNCKTVVTVSGAGKPQVLKVEYPRGSLYRDEGDTYRVYEGQATIRALVQRASGDAGPLQVGITVNACTNKVCLLPGHIDVTVP